MKLVRFSENGHLPRPGSLKGDRVVDLAATYEAYLDGRGVVRARELALTLFPSSTRAFLQAGAAATDALAAMDQAVVTGRLEWIVRPLASVRLLAPIHDPDKLICIGLNYKDHTEEGRFQIPPEPLIFAKFANAILNPGEPILRPKGCQQLDYEVELGVVMGRTAKDIPPEGALEYVFGYTIVHDVSARDFQFRTSQVMGGKISDTFAPIGPFIADRTEIPDPHALELKTWVNGTLLQHGNTKNLIFDVAALVSFLSLRLTLSPGDVIATGTPAGVGFTREPPVYLFPGDMVRMEITGLGVLENPVKDA
ncbi:MAG: fumarylacetoacetate hydrolase family protein [candidate division NC10 bacterium]|nr:fumarylacetoacetate hydrolase family protein [candidate division NC10 bacterium]